MIFEEYAIKTNESIKYEGHCEVFFKTHRKIYSAVFPTYQEALKAANFGVNPQVGGFLGAIISESSKPITHKTGEGWLYDEDEL